MTGGPNWKNAKTEEVSRPGFLKDTWPVDKVVEKLRHWKVERVLEIGPGGGILTRGLLDEGLKVTAVEKDDRFAVRLEDFKRTWQPQKGAELEIVNQDVLKFSLDDWLKLTGEPVAVVGNIPYNVSSSILLWVLPHLAKLQGACFLVQLEFAQRLASSANAKSYGSLSVFAQLRSRVKMECKVDRSCFVPIPKVDSAIVSLMSPTNSYSEKVLKDVEQVSRLAFQQRRKKMLNAISPLLEKVSSEDCPIDLSRRPDTIRPEEYLELAAFFFGKET